MCGAFLYQAEHSNKLPNKLLEERVSDELGEGFINISHDLLKQIMTLAGHDVLARMLSIEANISLFNMTEEKISQLEAKWDV